ncbi:hypothetical protein BG011_004139 [Mortierella polycephala]|uniref:Glutathione S-transferase n=1 Tax=Mortierella polycephala TaxID=41804 RepID=A0A9P6Q1C7_9FUNG|nr:hypothetical protein BG011_004139 [Mortierella polycephala]
MTIVPVTKNLSTDTMSKLSQAKDNQYTMLYFPFHGVVPALRAILAMSGEKYTFIHPEDWAVEKHQTPFGHMPVLYETAATGETLELGELSVIEFYLATKFGLMGSNTWEDQLIRSYTSSTESLFDKFVMSAVRTPKEFQKQMTELFVEKQIPEWAEYHERILRANGTNGHYIGDQLTFADIKTGTVLGVMIALSGDNYITKEKTPGLLAVYEMLEKHPKYAAWKASDQWKEYAETSRKVFGLQV